ncbi:MAG: tetratricopeptide repeat protein [Candidatus Helarchaeota archaeon]
MNVGKAITLNAIGTVYNNLAKFQEASTYHQKALEIRTALLQ